MANEISANYIFLPWVRQGVSADIQTPDTLGNPNLPVPSGVATVNVNLKVNTDNLAQPVRLYGPGDVTGIDQQQVIRTEPAHLARDFEPNYFPAIEFDRPEFPWLFTPLKNNPENQLRPWICLVVVRKQDGVAITSDPTRPLPVLEIKGSANASKELPDLSESWAWAHAQVSGSRFDAESVKTALGGDPALTLSRLLCPRKLEPLTDYIACVVPTFELGRLAGLGEKIEQSHEEKLKPAWENGAAEVRLPVYYQWEFSTGAAGDFELLASLLEIRDLPAGVGSCEVEITLPGAQVPGPPVKMEGALRVWKAEVPSLPANTRAAVQPHLKGILNTPAATQTSEAVDPLVAPPIYGEWYAARHTVNLPSEPTPSHSWLDTLNLDPRHRAAAALGTKVVQTQQEQLMASAWDQLGEIQAVNRRLRQAQLARAVSGALRAKHFARFDDPALLNVITPAQSRLVVIDPDQPGEAVRKTMLATRIEESPIPEKAFSGPMRRITRARGPVSTRFREVAARSEIPERLNTTRFVTLQKPEAGLVTAHAVFNQIPALADAVNHVVTMFNDAPPHNQFRMVPEGAPIPAQPGGPGQTDDNLAKVFRAAALAKENYLGSVFRTESFHPKKPVDFAATKEELLEKINPDETVVARVRASLQIEGEAPAREDELDPITDHPEFKQPLGEALRELAPELLFPGLGQMPTNTIALLQPNATFVESFMAGANHELGRELLWRKYPTDQRGTYFKHFWERPADDGRFDVGPIQEWSNGLGVNANDADNVVLIICGDLLRRYPNTVIYAAPATKDANGKLIIDTTKDEKHPLFRGTLPPDATFLGFDLTDTTALAGDGYFFVIQQQPTELRFGLDEAKQFADTLTNPTKWNQLSWGHLVANEAAYKELTHVSVAAQNPLPVTSAIADSNARWRKNSAHMAHITRQDLVRVMIHASDFLKKREN